MHLFCSTKRNKFIQVWVHKSTEFSYLCVLQLLLMIFAVLSDQHLATMYVVGGEKQMQITNQVIKYDINNLERYCGIPVHPPPPPLFFLIIQVSGTDQSGPGYLFNPPLPRERSLFQKCSACEYFCENSIPKPCGATLVRLHPRSILLLCEFLLSFFLKNKKSSTDGFSLHLPLQN